MSIPQDLWQGEYDRLFIGGRWVRPSSDRRIQVISPSSEDIIASVPEAVEADIDAAITRAREAFDHGPWPRLSLEERLAVVRRFSAGIEERVEDIAKLVTAEMGCPITLSRSYQATLPRLMTDTFIESAQRYPWVDTRTSDTGNALVTREPVGVVAAIIPWNAPLLTSILKVVPALIAGCTVVLKPTPETPLDAYLLADQLQRAGLPEGVLSVVPAQREVSEYLVRHPGIDKVSFTGSTAAGRRIAAICGEEIRRCTLELGGKSAALLLEDADFDAAIAAIRAVSLRNSGQVCSNKTRIVVARPRLAELNERLVQMIESMPVGDPFDAATEIGPLANRNQRERVERYIAEGKNSGATLLIGGDRPSGLDRGFYISPTVFTDVDPNSRIAQEEIFGPVLTVHAFDTEEEAVAIANNSDYGLSGSVFAGEPERALGVARRIRTGTVEVNGSPGGFAAPIGGFKRSGIGRESGMEGFDAYVEVKSYGLPREVFDRLR
ncbi:aldehyde dehydrogenase [Arthrobacter bambusae]|uniref:aldehyde dehydrogenase n=1 Tax=Arthrobacter bambusae TaxID=1338426 RepID=UPI001F50FB03|nr:aldehyde dehydrogenase [Arthrobacter bambusae]MCI0142609.1 aldehyde dehydrogenase [Arthrobacter bambusae]